MPLLVAGDAALGGAFAAASGDLAEHALEQPRVRGPLVQRPAQVLARRPEGPRMIPAASGCQRLPGRRRLRPE